MFLQSSVNFFRYRMKKHLIGKNIDHSRFGNKFQCRFWSIVVILHLQAVLSHFLFSKILFSRMEGCTSLAVSVLKMRGLMVEGCRELSVWRQKCKIKKNQFCCSLLYAWEGVPCVWILPVFGIGDTLFSQCSRAEFIASGSGWQKM